MTRFATPVAAMQHALALAARGLGYVEPNPPVGAVIVDADGNLLGEGWHQRYGGPHAEVHALEQAGASAHGATLYVTLEPCCHFGKTPPCSRAVIAAGLKRVVVAMSDPNPRVEGGGIAELQAAGIAVEVGVCEAEAKVLTAPFVRWVTERRPWVHAKWAMTLDGKIASRTGHSQWISGPESREKVHELRGRMDAIAVGIGTVLADDPLLTARPPGPRTATRTVIDPQGRMPQTSQLVRTINEAPVLWVVGEHVTPEHTATVEAAGVERLSLRCDPQQGFPLSELLSILGQRSMTHVLVEGGGHLLGRMFDAGLIDEYHVFIAPKLIGGATAPSPLNGLGGERIPSLPSLDHPVTTILGNDLYIHGRAAR